MWGWPLFAMKLVEQLVVLVDHVAWPVAVVLVAFIFRKPITDVLKRMRGLRYGEMEASFFEEEIETAKAEAVSADESFDSNIVPDDPDLLAIADKYPVFAVVEGWKRIEEALNAVLRRFDVDVTSRMPIYRKVGLLVSQEKMTPEMADLIRRMSTLRNLAAHKTDSGITKSDAYEYVSLTSYLTKHLDGMGIRNG